MTDCCATLPRVTKFEEAETACGDCQSKPKTDSMCCFVDCLLKKENVLNSTGLIDLELMKAKLLENADPAWGDVINNVLTECTRSGKRNSIIFNFINSPIYYFKHQCL